jgi:hypothetical protein
MWVAAAGLRVSEVVALKVADCFSIEAVRRFRWTTSKVGILSMQLSPLCTIGVMTASIVTWNVTISVAIQLTPFRYEAQAQRYCPADAIVWLDFRKGIYYSRGQRQYARGFNGSFVCRDEARRSGFRRSLLGLR